MRASCSAPAPPSAATPYRERGPTQQQYEPPPASGGRRSAGRPTCRWPAATAAPSFRLGDVYAEELDRLRQHAHAEGFAAGHAEGMQAADAVVAETERAAAERLTDVQARWERRVASATAALGAAATRFDEATVPVADDDPRDDRRDGPDAGRGPPRPRARPRRLPRPRRRPPRADPAALPTPPPSSACTPTTSPRSRPRRSPNSPTPSGSSATPPSSGPARVAETGPRRIDAQLMAALERVQAVLTS